MPPFCLAPWLACHNRADGGVSPCCQWSGEPLGSLREATLEQILTGPRAEDVRSRMRLGAAPAACASCLKDERVGIPSLRQAFHEFGRSMPGNLQDDRPALRWLHLSFSNLCDYRCRTCGPRLSSGWYQDLVQVMKDAYGNVPKPVVLQPAGDEKAFLRQIEPWLETAEVVQFSSSGEPLLAGGHYRLLGRLLELGRTDVRLIYNTNFGTLEHAGLDVLKLWARFENVSIAASLDAMGSRGEYIRKGQDWDKTASNRRRMLEVCPRARFMIAPTVSIFNVLHLPDFHLDWIGSGLLDVDAIHLNLLRFPEHLCVQVLPGQLKRRVAERYERHARELSAFGDAGHRAARLFAGAVRFMDERDSSHQLALFKESTRRLDRMRGEDAAAVFPELRELFET